MTHSSEKSPPHASPPPCMPLVDFPQNVDHLHRSHSLLADGPSSSPAGHRGMPLRALSDELIEEIVKAYLDRTCADDPLALCAAPLTELGPILYGRDRCGPGGAADDDRRFWKHACAKLGLPALPTYQGAPTTWRAAFRALRAEVSQLSDDGRDSFRRLVRRRPYSVELLFQAALRGHAIVVAVILAREVKVLKSTDSFGRRKSPTSTRASPNLRTHCVQLSTSFVCSAFDDLPRRWSSGALR